MNTLKMLKEYICSSFKMNAIHLNLALRNTMTRNSNETNEQLAQHSRNNVNNLICKARMKSPLKSVKERKSEH